MKSHIICFYSEKGKLSLNYPCYPFLCEALIKFTANIQDLEHTAIFILHLKYVLADLQPAFDHKNYNINCFILHALNFAILFFFFCFFFLVLSCPGIITRKLLKL